MIQNQIENMQKAHDIEIRNVKNVAKNYAIEFFKTKAEDVNKIFSAEVMRILEKFEKMRD